MALKHHWKFNGNLQDAVGDLHLVNVVGTPAYTSNKDVVANSCLDNSVAWYASSDSTLECGDAQRSYSFWIKKDSDTTNNQSIFQDRFYWIYRQYNNIAIQYRYSSSYTTLLFLDASNILSGISIDEWFNIIITLNNNGLKKVYINGVLKFTASSNITPFDGSYPVFINIRSPSGQYPQKSNIDEIKYFDHILTDGGITTVGEVASLDSEVWQLYLAGVNNIPAYTLNPATDITGTSAKLSWNES